MTNPVQSISLGFYANLNNGSHPICFLCDDIKSNADTAARSTTRLKSGGGVEAGVDPAGGQGEQRKEDASQ